MATLPIIFGDLLLRKLNVPFPGSYTLLGLLLIIFQISVVKSISSNNFDLLAQPSNVTVREGESATFQCSVRFRISFTMFADVTSYWINGVTETVNQLNLFYVTTSLNASSKIVTSKLIITEVHREMNMLYKCSVVFFFKDKSNFVFPSKFGWLNVQYFLEQDEIYCRRTSIELREGDRLKVKCEAAISNPPAKLILMGPEWISLTPPTSIGNDTLFMWEMTVERILHNHELYCVATSEVFPNHQVSCTFGPFKVSHIPSVEVVPRQAELIWPLVAEMYFKCKAEGYPEVEEYNWFCYPETAFEECTSQSLTLKVLINHVQFDGSLNVTCEARNSEGFSRNSSLIRVHYVDHYLIPDCSISSRYTPLVIHPNSPSISYDKTLSTLRCVSHVIDILNVTFHWYLDGQLINKGQGDLSLMQSTEGGDYIIAYNDINVTSPGIFVCDVGLHASSTFSLNIATCNLSGYFVGDTTTASNNRWRFSPTGERHLTESQKQNVSTVQLHTPSVINTDSKERFWEVLWMVSVTIAVSFGILFCSALMVYMWQTIIMRGRSQHRALGHIMNHLSSNSSHIEHGSSGSSTNKNPVYEIPDENSHMSISSITNSQEKLSCSNGKNYQREQSLNDTILDVHESLELDTDSSSCSMNGDFTQSPHLNEDEETRDFEHYENRKVIEAMVENVNRRCLRATLANNYNHTDESISDNGSSLSSICEMVLSSKGDNFEHA